MLPLIAASEAGRRRRRTTRSSSRTCGTARPCRSTRTSRSRKELLPRLKAINAILEVEIGVVGGEEDGVQHEGSNDAPLHDRSPTSIAGRRSPRPRRAGPLDRRAHLRQRARRLQARQREAAPRAARRDPGRASPRSSAPARSRSTSSSTAAAARPTTRSPLAVANGVVKMNIDTDTQYAFTRAVAGYMFKNYDGVLKVDGEVGNKKAYDPRAWGKVAESAMAARVVEATQQLGSAGKSHVLTRHSKNGCLGPGGRGIRRSRSYSGVDVGVEQSGCSLRAREHHDRIAGLYEAVAQDARGTGRGGVRPRSASPSLAGRHRPPTARTSGTASAASSPRPCRPRRCARARRCGRRSRPCPPCAGSRRRIRAAGSRPSSPSQNAASSSA